MVTRLSLVRRDRGLSQLQLGNLVGLAPQDISALERGHKNYPGWRQRVAKALGIDDVEWLFQEVSQNEAASAR